MPDEARSHHEAALAGASAARAESAAPASRLQLAHIEGPSWFDGDDAPGAPGLHACIHCGLCLTACPTYRETKLEPESPRGRIYLMRALSEGRVHPDGALEDHLDSCLGCRACETVCPAGVPYGELLESTRGQMHRRARRRSALERLGSWMLGDVFPERARLHLLADLMRLGQRTPVAALLESPVLRARLPRFVVQGWDLLPRIEPRRLRALEQVSDRLPEGARLEERQDALVFRPAGTPRARAALFTSCVMETMLPRVNQEMTRLLVLAGCEVVVPRGQTCCGALHAHAGQRHRAKDLARRNVLAFGAVEGSLGPFDLVVNASAGCGAALREYGHLLVDEGAAEAAGAFAARVRDVSEALVQLGLPPSPRPPASEAERPLRVAVHDPCHLAHAQKVRSAPRELLRALPGVECVDLANSDWCCGSAGVYNLTHPEMAERQLERKLASVAGSGAQVVVASNPGCQLQIARGARRSGLPARIAHLVEILAEAYPPIAPGTSPSPH
jgi:glycolate oxidase iron-sulfur subunit